MFKKVFFLCIAIFLCNNFVFGQKTDVWDFGAQQLDVATYNNNFTESIINGLYSVAPGTSGVVFPATFSVGALSWLGGSNDRLRTSNNNLSRYDNNINPANGTVYTGRLYVNASAATGRYLTLALNEDDEVSVIENSDLAGRLNFINVANPAAQSNLVTTTTTPAEYKFVAKSAGNYKIYDDVSKPSYYRILRKAATYVTITGSIDTSKASTIPAGYSIIYTNAAGKSWSATITGSNYSITVPSGYQYSLKLGNANGFIITNGDTFDVTTATTTHDIVIEKVTLYPITGSISGLGTNITNLNLIFTPDPAAGTLFVPKPVINASAGTYTVNLEAIQYTISATGVNDFEIPANSLAVTPSTTTANINFSLKPKYNITVNTPDLNSTQKGLLNLTFTNVNEAGYSYSFSDLNNINLRDGSYSITSNGLDSYPLELGLTSYLKVNGASTTKDLKFNPVTNWSFDDKVITNATPNYKGLAFTGNIVNEIAKGHIVAQSGSSISVPMMPGDKIVISYYYAANFSIDGGTAITTSSGSTSTVEKTEYTYPGSSAGNAVISVAGTTYITDITLKKVVSYSPTITVGAGKNYQKIGDALDAVSSMVRDNTQRVTILVDPGNYEEMIVVNSPNVTLKNASSTPSIALNNQGVGIDVNAVRITSYYGVGYNYYSQGTDNKWNADALAVNKENGFTNYTNVSGSTNGSYWNATAVINANNFEAEDIIFENSYNQYISQKESQDVVVPVTGNKGVRPTTVGSVAVQNKSFVERAAAIAVPNNVDKVFLKNCRVVGRQDSFYGGTGARVAVYKGVMMGGTDYIFGPMTATFYQSDFAMNVSDVNTDVSYLTAPQQLSGRGFLLYECKVTSAIPGVETASTYRAKPGYFGRPWAQNTGEAVMYNTTVETSDSPGFLGLSLINPAGWLNTLSGTSDRVYEYGTIENSGVDNSANRVSWSKVLSTPQLSDGTQITTFNFTKGSDGWDPFASLITLGVNNTLAQTKVKAFASDNRIYITNVKSKTEVKIYGMNGSLIKTKFVNKDVDFDFPAGVWVITLKSSDGVKSVKVMTKKY